ncbi:hypothetical protein SAMN05428974_1300 [Sphingopyxis sp. YR583]|uniref:transcriptional regulator domain-containing protein n=1 Tax=Sphingopyxis sp. YR583 TaxID=1881047 RepID=UPI0008A76DD7|nr:hypothetical protein SAMN05428974_1300 [Sphingopyxis sp. YR583]
MPGYQNFCLPAPYDACRALDARGFAWEWLRRNPDFRALWSDASRGARQASADALATVARSRRPLVRIGLHPLARRLASWGLTFRAAAGHIGDGHAAGRLAPRNRCHDADHRPSRTMGAARR